MIDLFNFRELMMVISFNCSEERSLLTYQQIKNALDSHNKAYPANKIELPLFFNLEIDCTWPVVKRFKNYGIITTKNTKYIDQLNVLQSIGFSVVSGLVTNDIELLEFLKKEKINPKDFRIIKNAKFDSPLITELLSILIAETKLLLTITNQQGLMSIRNDHTIIYAPKDSTVHHHTLLSKVASNENDINLDEIYKNADNVNAYQKQLNSKLKDHLAKTFPNSLGKVPNKYFEKYYFSFKQGKCLAPPGIIFENEFIN